MAIVQCKFTLNTVKNFYAVEIFRSGRMKKRGRGEYNILQQLQWLEKNCRIRSVEIFLGKSCLSDAIFGIGTLLSIIYDERRHPDGAPPRRISD